MIFVLSTKGVSQDRGNGELYFTVSGLEDNSKTYISVTPKSGKTRWRGEDNIEPYEPYIPCT